jgi:hypothetical protein
MTLKQMITINPLFYGSTVATRVWGIMLDSATCSAGRLYRNSTKILQKFEINSAFSSIRAVTLNG